jgi:orotate phosphoribosyltransferase
VSPKEVLELYRLSGALREGHFRLSSGLHSDRYFQSALVLAMPYAASNLAYNLKQDLYHNGEPLPDVIIGPAVGAIVIAHALGDALNRPSFYAERVNGMLALRRGFQFSEYSNVLLIEDVVTTAGSILELKELVERLGGNVSRLCCLIDRRDATVRCDVPIHSLAQAEVKTWKPEDCLLCQEGAALEVPGTRKLV